ncbi:MAG: isoprenylcysteine carboxylmethyltransferase family protein [Pseudomonadota bacterium]
MNAYKARSNSIPWPPIITLAAAILAVLAAWVYRLPFPQGAVLQYTGVLLLIFALAIDIWSIFTMRAAQTTVMPTKGSTHLVTNGPFGYSRNPIYLGNILLLLALSLILANAWFVILAAAAAIGMKKLAVDREELHLLAVFGAEYEDYCRRVRRWL